MNKVKNSRQLTMGVIFSYLSELVTIITGLVYTPVMLRLLGKSEYGLYQLVNSTVSYLSLIGMGFSSSYQRYYARAQSEDGNSGKSDNVKKLNGMFLCIFLIMSLICLLCGVVLIANIRAVFGTGLTDSELETAKILMALLVFNMALTFPNSLFTSYLIAHEEFTIQKGIILLHKILNPFLCLPLLIMGYGSVAMVAVSSFLTVLSFILNVYACVHRLKIKINMRGFEFRKFKEMWSFTFFIFLNQIVVQINWSTDKYLLGRFCGTETVAVYSVGGQLRSLYSQFSTSVSNVFIPTVNQIVAENDDNDRLTKLFTQVGSIQFVIMGLILTGFILFGKSFILLWAGAGYDEAYYIAAMFFCVLFIPYIQSLGVEIQRAKNKHQIRSIVYSCIAVGNVLISIPLIRMYGATGAAIGTVIAVFIGNNVFMNFYYHKYIGLNVLYFWKKILRIAIGLIIPVLAGIELNRLLMDSGWGMLAVKAAIYVLVYLVSIWFIGIGKDEKGYFLSFFIRKKSK